MDKKQSRLRRAKKVRIKIKKLGMPRLCVNRTSQHIYAQIIVATEKGDTTIVSASTLDKDVIVAGAGGGNIKSATIVGQFIAKKATENGIEKIAFDRSGFKYHGCIKALADAVRESGINF